MQLMVRGVIVSLLVLSNAAFAQGVELSLASGSGAPGSAVTLDLTLKSGQATLAGVQWTLNYWPVDVSSVQVSAGPAAVASGKPVLCAGGVGTYKCLIVGLEGGTITTGVLAQVAIQVAGGTTDAVSAIGLSGSLGATPSGDAVPIVAHGAVLSIAQPPQLSSLVCNPRDLTANGAASCTVALSAPAGAAGATVGLASGSSNVTVPSQVAIGAGTTSAGFTLTGSPVVTAEIARVTARMGSGAVNTSVILAPAGAGISAAAVLNAAQYTAGPVAPGEIVTIYGSGIGPAKGKDGIIQSGFLTTSIDGVNVLFDGNAAPLLYVRSDQINAVVPFGVSVSAGTKVQIQYGGALSNILTVPVVAANPGIFTLDSSGMGQAAILNPDGSGNTAANPATQGSIVSIYATGAGATNPLSADGSITGTAALPVPVAPVFVWIGGVEAEVLYQGAAPQFVAGALQVNARVPAGITPGPSVPVQLVIGEAKSQAGVTLAVQ